MKHWLAQHPRFVVHFTPTHASWMNLVEVWFGIVERQAIRRGVSKSVPDLNTKIRAFINGWNDRAHPFVWTKTAENRSSRRPTLEGFKCGPLALSTTLEWRCYMRRRCLCRCDKHGW